MITITTASQAIDWLYQQPAGKSKDGLQAIQQALGILGNPHLSVPTVHITGTNGKGSTIATLASILQEHGLSVATFTSPHLIVFNDRIRLNGQFISEADLVKYVNQLQDIHLSQFELYTCIFFLFIAEYKPDIALVEVGIGGLKDATNVIQPILTAITSVGFDHVGLLGNTLGEIAIQKAGIVKPSVPLLVSRVASECLAIFQSETEKKGSPLLVVGKDFQYKDYKIVEDGFTFTFDNQMYHSQLEGSYQLFNVTLSLACAKQLLGDRFDVISAQKGVKRTRWEGRMEKVFAQPKIYLDGAHNEQGILALLETIKQRFPKQPVQFIFGALSRKDYSQMLEILAQAYPTYVTTFAYEEAATLTELSQISLAIQPLENWQAFIEDCMFKQADVVTIFTGSLYFIAEVKAYFNLFN